MKPDNTMAGAPLDTDAALGGGAPPSFLAGGGEMGGLIRAHDWRATPLGAPDGWPQSLKTAIGIMLASRQPIWIGWGPDLIFFYNDPYKSIIGGKHPVALGQPTSIVWREIWSEIGPLLQTALNGVEGTFTEQKLLIMERNGYPEETYYTFSYSPVPDDHGGTGGIICANSDDTARVLGERQLRLLREISSATSAKAVCARLAAILTTSPSRSSMRSRRAARSCRSPVRAASRPVIPPRRQRWMPRAIPPGHSRMRCATSVSCSCRSLRYVSASRCRRARGRKPAGRWPSFPCSRRAKRGVAACWWSG